MARKPPGAGAPAAIHWNGMEITSQVEMVTPEQAAAWLEEAEFEKQRRSRDYHIKDLAEVMKDDEFEPGAIKFHMLREKSEARPYLTDGRHRLKAIIKSGVAVPLIIIRIWVESYAAVRDAYHRTDAGLKRTTAESFPFDLIAQDYEVTEAQVALTEKIVPFIASGLIDSKRSGRRDGERSRDKRLRDTRHWLPWSRDYFTAISECSQGLRKALQETPVVAVGALTMRWCPDEGRAFWGRVGRGENLQRGQPEYMLVELLGAQMSASGRERRPPNEMARAVAACWNAAWDSRDLKKIVVGGDGKKPLLLRGTPYDGTRRLGTEDQDESGSK